MPDNQDDDLSTLQNEWELALERATQDWRIPSDSNPDALNDAAGVRVQSGVRAGGLWSGSCNDPNSCGCF